MDQILCLVLLIIFLATFVRSLFGFGDGLVAMPLLAMVIDIRIATALVGLLSICMATTMFIQHRKSVQFLAAKRLIFGSLFGIPIGLLLLTQLDERIIKILLGVLILSFSTFVILKPTLFTLKTDRWGSLFGLFAGMFAGAYNTPGPTLAIYSTLRGWAADEVRATMQGFFMPTSFLVIAGHGMSGLWNATVFWYWLCSLPVLFITLFVGSYLSKFIPKAFFIRAIHVMLIGIALMLIGRSLWG